MSTSTDIRIAVSFKGHRKRRKLRVLLGPGSTDYLIDLWINTATNHPDGVLVGMSAMDVALEAGWEDDPEKFVSAMRESGFLDQDENGTYQLHDWEDHQPWVVGSEGRSKRAKAGAKGKWGDSSDPHATRSERLKAAREKGTHTQAEWDEMLAFFGGSCVRCGARGQMVKDHIVPIYQGGSDGIGNLQPLCRSCNSSKGPESKDFRRQAAGTNAPKMPSKWLLDDCLTPTPSPSFPTYQPEEEIKKPPYPPEGGGAAAVDLPPSPEDDPDAQPNANVSDLNECLIEFQDLAHVFQEAGGGVDVAPAYKLFLDMRFGFPLARVVDDLAARSQSDAWQRMDVPMNLSTYLSKKKWLDPIPKPRARASPSRDPTTPRNYRECQDLERRQEAARLKEAMGGHDAGFQDSTGGIGAIQPRPLPAKSVDA